MTHSSTTTFAMATTPDGLEEEPAHYADCCVAVSRPLVQMILDRLPRSPALTLSIGSGSGFLEHLLLKHASADGASPLNLYGIEVPSCVNKYLPEDRLRRVASTSSVDPEAMFASAVIFVYPRQVSLISQYLDACLNAALEKVLWLGHRSDWPGTEGVLAAAFDRMEYCHGPGIAEYELLVVATHPKVPPRMFAKDG